MKERPVYYARQQGDLSMCCSEHRRKIHAGAFATATPAATAAY